MPRPHLPEFRARAIELAREHTKPMAALAHDLGISESCLRNWVAKAYVDEGGRTDGDTSSERASRRVVGWSIADHIRSELVVDACRWPSGAGNHRPARLWPIPITDPKAIHLVGLRPPTAGGGTARLHGHHR